MGINSKEVAKEPSESLYQALSDYAETDFYPYHMPGHKRNPDAGEMAAYYRFDITEIDGFDNLYHAEGILKEAQERANRLYGAEETYYLVNGSTCGVLAAIMAVTDQGDELLIARNCHKSVYHAAMMQGLVLRYYCPGMIEEYDIYDGADAQEIGRLLDRYPDSKAVVITSPTYEGILSDISAIAKVVHDRGRILIVDEAHGAHLKKGAVAGGADLVIHSLHKTLPAMTQTALLHVCGNCVDRQRLRKYLAMLQTSSPSYVMMASMDCCIRYMEKRGRERNLFMQKQYDAFCKKLSGCRHIRIGKMTYLSQNMKKGYVLTDWDIGKIVISVKGTSMTGQQLYDILRDEYHLQMEMAAATYVLAIMTVMDTKEGWQRLADAIVQIDDRIEENAESDCAFRQKEADRLSVQNFAEAREAEVYMTPAQAFRERQEEVPLNQSTGRVMADFIALYPPGIPLLVPGEIMSEDLMQTVQNSIAMGLQVHGVTDTGMISVIASDLLG